MAERATFTLYDRGNEIGQIRLKLGTLMGGGKTITAVLPAKKTPE